MESFWGERMLEWDVKELSGEKIESHFSVWDTERHAFHTAVKQVKDINPFTPGRP